jgi:hypothetical protein
MLHNTVLEHGWQQKLLLLYWLASTHTLSSKRWYGGCFELVQLKYVPIAC